jgi:hypothetical protein
MRFLVFLIWIYFSLTCLKIWSQVEYPSMLERKDCFFGLHFDLHAQEEMNQLGLTLTEGMVDSLLRRVKPDFIQVDCKGHPGISSYPTRVGFKAQGYTKDPMKLWREKTLEYGIGLYVHFSGIYDRKVVSVNPDWAVVHADKTTSDRNTSFFSPYVDTYLIPQLKELNDVYHIDGAWIDGDCWSVEADYGQKAIEAFIRETGINEIPLNKNDNNYFEFQEFFRRKFKEYVKHYVDAIHEHNPGFQITSNWAYSSMMPEEVGIDLDYLSGDLQPVNSVYSAAFEARCLAQQGKPWDLMAWSFTWDPGRNLPSNTKSAIQLMQEGAEVIATGGGIQFYFKQNQDLSIQPWTIDIMEELSKFFKPRKNFCHKVVSVPQIAILYSEEDFRRRTDIYSGGWYNQILEPIKGCLNALLDNQYCVDILMDHHLKDKLYDYPLLVVPNCQFLSEATKDYLLEYAERGGKLLIVGNHPVQLFREELGIKPENGMDTPRQYISVNNILTNTGLPVIHVKPAKKLFYEDFFFNLNDTRFKNDFLSASVTPYGKGLIAGIYFDLGQSYFNSRTPGIRDFLTCITEKLFPDPLITIDGSKMVHMTANQKENKLIINLINSGGTHADPNVTGFDQIPPIGPLQVKIRLPAKPDRIMHQPDGEELIFKYENGYALLIIPVIDIHYIIVIE